MDMMNVSSALDAVKASPATNTLKGAVSMKMLDKTLDMNEQMNDSMIRMMERSVNPHIGGNFDESV